MADLSLTQTAGLLQRWRTLCAGLERAVPLDWLQLAMRIAVGSVFFRSGLLKIESFDFAVLLFRDEYKVPLLDPVVAAYLGTGLELAMPVLLYVGLLTRVATVPLLGMALVIQIFIYPQAWNEHLMWAVPLTFLLTRGPGRFSLDHWLRIGRGSRPA
ncbi:MAG: DoxX family protein [Alphaproteobacteria bacterium]|nr:DoxX family protein [Alphaproteobacteria bacterium]